MAAAKTKGGNPDVSYYNGFIASLPKADITTRAEAAKFLSHAVWETVGFQYTKEVYCQTNMDACKNAYPANSGGRQDVVYYGRGCLQLTWDYNYKACSQYLFGDDRLIQNPDQVANDPAIAWSSAAWFWHANVHATSATFGQTLKAINGALECDGGSHSENRVLRFNHYKQILQILNMPTPPDSDGACQA
jgi:predicted chitinase